MNQLTNGENLTRVNIMLDPAELAVIDAKAGELGISRSALVRDAIHAYLESGCRPFIPASEDKVAALIAEARRLAKVNQGWDGLAELRRGRDRS